MSEAQGPEVVSCPSCSRQVAFTKLNAHLDQCLAGQAATASGADEGRAAPIFRPAMSGQKRKEHDPPSERRPRAESQGVAHVTNDDADGQSSKKRVRAEAAAAATTTTTTMTTTQPSSSSKDRMENVAPLAERLRPRTLEDFVGQKSIVEGPLRSMLRQAKIPSMILWGPPGSGKTTLARIVTRSANEAAAAAAAAASTSSTTSNSGGTLPFRFVEISGTTATTADCKKIFDESINRLQLTGQRTVVFIDEVQRFSRAQQDVFLPVVEKGHCILIAATTENPSFRLQSALLSRMRVFVLSKLSQQECFEVLHRARRRAKETGYDDLELRVDDDLLRWMANVADGDARTSISVLELAIDYLEAGASTEDKIAKLKAALQRNLLYDRTGDGHYDTISALHKSIRGSNADAALYWLARMVEAGDDPLFIARRLIVAASEDCNTLEALQMATATYHACQVVGLPECGENLAQCVVFLAESPKSTRAYRGWKKAQALVHGSYNYPVPIHIRNAPTRLMKDLGYAKEYRYEPSWVHPVHQDFFPPELKSSRLLSPPPPEAEEPGQRPQLQGNDEHLDKEEEEKEQSQRQAPPLMNGQAGIGPGSCQRIFQIGARAADLDLLDEWEHEHNDGRPWKGRRALMVRIRKEGKPVEDRTTTDDDRMGDKQA